MPAPTALTDERAALRRGLRRSRLAALTVLVIAIALGAAAVVAALRSERLAAESRGRLWETLVAQARAERLAGEVGGRTKALAAIREAAAILPTPELRDEAIAALALPDLETIDRWPGYAENGLMASFSPELTYYAIDLGRRIEIFETATRGRLSHKLKRPSFPAAIPYYPRQLLFSPDESMLAGLYSGGFAVVWEVPSGRERWRVRFGSQQPDICGLSFDARSETLAVAMASEGEARLYSATDGELRRTVRTGARISAMALSPDTGALAWEDGDKVTIDFLDGSRPPLEIEVPSAPMELRWTPDGRRVAAGCYGGELLLIDVGRGFVQDFDPCPSVIHGMDISPDGEVVMAAAWDGITRLWDAASGSLMLEAHDATGQQISSGGEIGFSRIFSELGRWRLVTSAIHRGYSAPGRATTDGFLPPDISPDNRWIAASSRSTKTLHIWDRATGELVLRGPAGVNSAVFSAAGDHLWATTPSGLKRWPLRDGAEALSLGDPDLIDPTPSLFPLELGPEGRRWATAFSAEGRGFRIDLSEGSPQLIEVAEGLPPEDGIAGFTLSADHRWAAAGGWRTRTTELWDLVAGKRYGQLEPFGGYAAFLPGGDRLAVGSQRGLTIWDTGGWDEVAHFPYVAAISTPTVVAWSPDGHHIAFTATQRSAQLIDLATLETTANFTVPAKRRIASLRFSDDGRFLVGGTRPQLDLWDIPRLGSALGDLGLRFGEQGPNPQAGGVRGRLAPGTAATFAGAVLLAALGFGLYSMLYQRRLVREFDAQHATLEQTRRELVQADKLKALGTLSAGVAHDFKNLLSVIRLSNDLIRRDAGTDEDILEEVEAIDKAVAQGDGVVKAMLGYSRSGGADAVAGVDVGDITEGVAALLGQQFLSGLRLRLDIARGLPAAAVPRGALEQILLNLIVNASEAMGGKGALTISVSTVDGGPAGAVLRPRAAPPHIAVAVADDGPGMDAETMGRIFEPFFTTKTRGADKGTGLGLATVYKIAEDTGLGLAVSSTPGEGATFELRLPVPS